MNCKETLEILGCHRGTLCRYVSEGTIRVIKKKNGRYDYNEEDVFSFIGKKQKKRGNKIISYSRVSTNKQKEQLKEQTQRIYDSCIARGIKLDEQIEDIKSGMNAERKGFDKLCQQVFHGDVQLIVIENKDRLTRFGYDYFEKFFKYFGTKILVLNDKLENKTYEQELTEDLISVIHYFTMKSYSHRRKLNKLRKELEQNEKATKSHNSQNSV